MSEAPRCPVHDEPLAGPYPLTPWTLRGVCPQGHVCFVTNEGGELVVTAAEPPDASAYEVPT